MLMPNHASNQYLGDIVVILNEREINFKLTMLILNHQVSDVPTHSGIPRADGVNLHIFKL